MKQYIINVLGLLGLEGTQDLCLGCAACFSRQSFNYVIDIRYSGLVSCEAEFRK